MDLLRSRPEQLPEVHVCVQHPVDRPVFVDDRRSGDHHFCDRRARQRLDLPCDLIRQPLVVVVAVGDVFSGRCDDPGVPGPGEPGSALVAHHTDGTVLAHIDGWVDGLLLVEHHQDFDRAVIVLTQDGDQRAMQQLGTLSRGDDDGHARRCLALAF